MTLDNLVGKNLEHITPDASVIRKLLAAAARNITDAQAENISAELRFDAAYKAIMQLANASLQASGYRTLTSKPGHHMTMLQSLAKTVGVESDTVMVLDALRKQRNVADYSGDPVTGPEVKECLAQGLQLQKVVQRWLKSNHPRLLKT